MAATRVSTGNDAAGPPTMPARGAPTAAACHHCGVDAVRIDRWLWAVRLTKSRTVATAACRAGHVRLNGAAAKAASPATVGDRIEVRGGDRDRVVEVTRVIASRVGAPVAATCYIDHTPAPDEDKVAARERGAGRPTKRERRELDRWRAGRD
ncbi:MAG: RNA-binding S4 domain-containing protein [Acidimicrobiia bacterium]